MSATRHAPPRVAATPRSVSNLGAASEPSRSFSKYGNKRVEVDGIQFPSKKQAARYAELKLLERGKVIRSLRLEVEYPLIVNGQLVCKYRADFDYLTESGAPITEDTKGFRTPVYRLKAKLFKAIYGREIVET